MSPCHKGVRPPEKRSFTSFEAVSSAGCSATPGFFLGTWSLLPGVVFPDTVVDAGPVLPSGQYAWVIELQCVQVANASSSEVIFVGINFYHAMATPGAAALERMVAAARARGLEVYMNHSFGMYTVPQTNCSWSND